MMKEYVLNSEPNGAGENVRQFFQKGCIVWAQEDDVIKYRNKGDKAGGAIVEIFSYHKLFSSECVVRRLDDITSFTYGGWETP